MSKVYSTSLKVDMETFDFLRKCCSSYCGIFNTAIDIQLHEYFYGANRREQIMSYDTLLKKVEETNNYLKLDKGIVQKATASSLAHFQDWLTKRLANSISETSSLPSHMKNKKYFRTSSILKVSKGGYVYLPKFGRIKLAENDYVPLGSYKNVTVTLEGSRWYISLESLEESQEEYELSGTLEVHIDKKLNISFEDNYYSSILEDERYQEAFTKWKKLSKKLKRQIEANTIVNEKGNKVLNPSKSMKLTRKQLERNSIRMKNLGRTYYQTIVKAILMKQPETLVIHYAEKLRKNKNFYDKRLWNDHIHIFIKLVERGAEVIGAQLEFSEENKEEIDLLNS